jgi:hypothetical protein
MLSLRAIQHLGPHTIIPSFIPIPSIPFIEPHLTIFPTTLHPGTIIILLLSPPSIECLVISSLSSREEKEGSDQLEWKVEGEKGRTRSSWRKN